jgi:protein-L-isoaspartate(D-aspartate) O-methyltransferase
MASEGFAGRRAAFVVLSRQIRFEVRLWLPLPCCVLAGLVSKMAGLFPALPRLRPLATGVLPMSDFSIARQKMVDGQVRPSDVTDIRIIDAMLAIPREAFVPQAQRSLAYLDLDIDVSEGGQAKRFLLRAAPTAKMLQAAAISETDEVLVVGCASGYLAVVAARLARRVTATECDSSLAAKARAAVAALAPGNVTVKTAPVPDGDSAYAPFDVIILNGTTEIPPENLYRQLKKGGRLVGTFALDGPQRAVIVTESHGDFGHRELFDTAIPVLPGLERPAAFVF